MNVLIYQWDCLIDCVILSQKLARQYSAAVIYLLGPPSFLPRTVPSFGTIQSMKQKAAASGKNININISYEEQLCSCRTMESMKQEKPPAVKRPSKKRSTAALDGVKNSMKFDRNDLYNPNLLCEYNITKVYGR